MAEPDVDPAISEEEDDDDDDVEDPPLPPPTTQRQRASVSAEAFGEWNKRAAFVAPQYDKSQAVIDELRSVLERSFLFGQMDAKDMQVVILAMKGPERLEPGAKIIQEGDAGDCLYVIQDGVLDCLKVLSGVDTVVKTCGKGDLFGELALLYNAPRAASVVCREASVVWSLDRETFNNIVMLAVQAKRDRLSNVLKKVQLFQKLQEDEFNRMVDALKLVKFKQGETILTQGEAGDAFYIVYEGEALATKVSDGGASQEFKHEAGDYFGELALLRQQPRAASIVASSEEVTCAKMDSATFKRLIGTGPVNDFLKENAGRYETS